MTTASCGPATVPSPRSIPRAPSFTQAADSINPEGAITGSYSDANLADSRLPAGSATAPSPPFDAPGSVIHFTSVSINPAGAITGSYSVDANVCGSRLPAGPRRHLHHVRCPGQVHQASLQAPSAVSDQPGRARSRESTLDANHAGPRLPAGTRWRLHHFRSPRLQIDHSNQYQPGGRDHRILRLTQTVSVTASHLRRRLGHVFSYPPGLQKQKKGASTRPRQLLDRTRKQQEATTASSCGPAL